MTFYRLLKIFLLLNFVCFANLYSEWQNSLFDQVKVTGTASSTYDSRVFGIPTDYYNQLKNGDGNNTTNSKCFYM